MFLQILQIVSWQDEPPNEPDNRTLKEIAEDEMISLANLAQLADQAASISFQSVASKSKANQKQQKIPVRRSKRLIALESVKHVPQMSLRVSMKQTRPKADSKLHASGSCGTPLQEDQEVKTAVRQMKEELDDVEEIPPIGPTVKIESTSSDDADDDQMSSRTKQKQKVVKNKKQIKQKSKKAVPVAPMCPQPAHPAQPTLNPKQRPRKNAVSDAERSRRLWLRNVKVILAEKVGLTYWVWHAQHTKSAPLKGSGECTDGGWARMVERMVEYKVAKCASCRSALLSHGLLSQASCPDQDDLDGPAGEADIEKRKGYWKDLLPRVLEAARNYETIGVPVRTAPIDKKSDKSGRNNFPDFVDLKKEMRDAGWQLDQYDQYDISMWQTPGYDIRQYRQL